MTITEKQLTVNVKLFKRIRAHILQEPLRFYMGYWFSLVNNRWDLKPACGTAACLAGWAVLLSGGSSRSTYNIEERAAKLLGLSPGMSAQLFYRLHWPQPFYRRSGGNERASSEDISWSL